MNLANTVRAAGPGALVGVLAGLMLSDLGVVGCLPGSLSAVDAILVVGALGAVLGYLRRIKIFELLTGTLVAAYLFIALTPLMAGLVRQWIRNDAVGQPVAAVIALSSSALSNQALDQQGADRLISAIELVQTDPGVRLLTTRVRVHAGGRSISSDSGQRELVRLAGLESRWTVVDSVYTTRDEALQARRLFATPGAPRIAVVTSPMHTRRACAAFEKAGFSVRCVAAREHSSATGDPRSATERLAAFRDYLYERLGWIKYRAHGWVEYSSK